MDDVDALHALWGDREVRRYLFSGEVPARERVIDIVEDSIRNFDEQGFGFFLVRLAVAPTGVIGFTGFRPFEDGDEVELLFAIAPPHWGRGYASEATREVLRFGFGECGLSRVVATTDTPNQRSVRVLQRLGLFFDQRRERHGLDTVYFAMTDEEFGAMRTAGRPGKAGDGRLGIAEQR